MSGKKDPAKSEKLNKALRENLKKRKGQMRKLGGADGEEGGFSVKLRSRDIPKSGPKANGENKD